MMNRACFSKNANLHEQNQHASSPAMAGQAIRLLKNNFVRMKRIVALLFSVFFIIHSGFCQQDSKTGVRIFFQGIVMDESSFIPIANSQIVINRSFSAVSGNDGTFAFFVNRNDTIVFKKLGYKATTMHVNDTLTGQEFVTGVFMSTDTLMIGEVVIVPRFTNLKSEILNSPSKVPATFDNAKYNVAVSAYQGQKSTGKLGNPADNYAYLHQKRKIDAYEKGGIPSDQIAGISPLLLLPAAYLLLHPLPDQADAAKPHLTDEEVKQLQKKYLETTRQR